MTKAMFCTIACLVGIILLSLFGQQTEDTGEAWAQGGRISGYRVQAEILVFDDVAIVGTAADTSDAISIGDSHYQTFYIATDTLTGGGTPDVKIQYEISRDGTTWAKPVGETEPRTLIASFSGHYGYDEYYIGIQQPMSIQTRFIATGTASNGNYTQLKSWVRKGP